MTPLAARLFRTVGIGKTGFYERFRKNLAGFQFFECTAIYEMASHMLHEDVVAGVAHYSENAQLPANATALEYFTRRNGFPFRFLVLCQQDGNRIDWIRFISTRDGVRFHDGCGFDLGSTKSHDRQIVIHEGEEAPVGALREDMLAECNSINGLVEKTLLIINQPNLTERVQRRTDKRIIRQMSRSVTAHNDILHWSQCRIRSGVHRKIGERSGEGAERQLHYVRKYFKPSQGIWIDGYWRGNADLGVHLKWYSAQPPRLEMTA